MAGLMKRATRLTFVAAVLCVAFVGLYPSAGFAQEDALGAKRYYYRCKEDELVVPPDTEFPRTIYRLDMFLRVFATDAGPTRFRVRVHHEARPGRWQLRNDFDDPRQVLDLPAVGPIVHSRSVRLPNVMLGGTGTHAISLYLRPDDDPAADDEWAPWNPDPLPWDPDEDGWRYAAVEFLYVVR